MQCSNNIRLLFNIFSALKICDCCDASHIGVHINPSYVYTVSQKRQDNCVMSSGSGIPYITFRLSRPEIGYLPEMSPVAAPELGYK